MSRIRSKDTKPEMIVRSALHRMGYRFRLNGKVSKKYHPKGVLPGKPDIVMAKHRLVIFVNGCFWHMHKGCKRSNIPKCRQEYWIDKLEKNVKRDKKNRVLLKSMGWNVKTVWECEVKNETLLRKLINKLLNQL
jgi:DNA mismatch endonuclease, patch repair protein